MIVHINLRKLKAVVSCHLSLVTGPQAISKQQKYVESIFLSFFIKLKDLIQKLNQNNYCI